MACPLLSMSTIYLKKKSMPSKRISRKSIVAGLLGGILVFFLFWLAGCASIVKGGTQKIRITSEPADAVVRIINDSNMGGLEFANAGNGGLETGQRVFLRCLLQGRDHEGGVGEADYYHLERHERMVPRR